MPRLTRIYTRTGDDGTTGLGNGDRVSKSSPRIEAYGLVDQLNSQIGVVLASQPPADLVSPLRRIQNELFNCGAELCIPGDNASNRSGPRVESRHVAALETLMDELSSELPPLENFILPGGCLAAAQLHVARTVCRNAERAVLRLREQEPIGRLVVPYLNRLSDALFVMSRHANRAAGHPDPCWDSRA
ncbi:MAG: cob(I)yrinic acid a,c-diamide adenosyltransferase [Planctomycetes bacterium]|nr:cob(I)yrinic acid a,c-diamide adenosyltransferase [Planctomycetota bacterium]